MNEAVPTTWIGLRVIAMTAVGVFLGGVASGQVSAGVSPADASQAVPVEVVETLPTNSGLAVTLVNRSSQVITAYLVGGTQSADPVPSYFEAVMQASGLEWQPGAELSTVLGMRSSDANTRVIVRAVVMADGRGYGDRAFIDRTVKAWQARRSALRDVLAVLDAAGVPDNDEGLQALIDQMALRMARVPSGAGIEERMAPYTDVVGSLKRLQHRDVVATDRFTREMTQLKDDLRRQLASVPGSR